MNGNYIIYTKDSTNKKFSNDTKNSINEEVNNTMTEKEITVENINEQTIAQEINNMTTDELLLFVKDQEIDIQIHD